MFRTSCLGLGVVLWLSGCSGGAPSDQPELGRVKGVVRLNGETLPNARVQFRPVEGGRASSAVTDANGEYDLNYLREVMGAKIGEHLVQITTYEDPVMEDNGKLVGGRKELLPESYARGDVERRSVSAGENTIDFDIKK